MLLKRADGGITDREIIGCGVWIRTYRNDFHVVICFW